MSKNKIDVVIPTMWRVDAVAEKIENYTNFSSINKIIVIDNNPKHRPKTDIFNHPKVKLICYGKNIYVNPAWNEGYYASSSDVVCLLNDDITVGQEVFDLVSSTDMSNIDVIGVSLKGTPDNYNIDTRYYKESRIEKLNVIRTRAIGGQAWAFGICIFVKRSSYPIIPSLYKVWYGDDWFVQRCENIYVLKTPKISGEISKTLVLENKNSAINKRIELDSLNVYRYGHFQNGQNWDFPKAAAAKFIKNQR